jgi:hypothetical protein
MSGLKSKRKGAAGERELFALLSERLGVPIRRALGAARDGGADSLDLPGYAFEAKRCEREDLPAWWKQAVEQAGERTPVLLYRANRQPWKAVVPVKFFADPPGNVNPCSPAMLDMETFLDLIRAKLENLPPPIRQKTPEAAK